MQKPHEVERQRMKEQVLRVLETRIGEDNAVTMTQLFVFVTGDVVIPYRRYDQTRPIRSIIKELRDEGKPIANSSKGYFMAETVQELQPTIDHFHSRAMSSLKTEAALKKIDPAGMAEQYALELNQEKEAASNGE